MWKSCLVFCSVMTEACSLMYNGPQPHTRLSTLTARTNVFLKENDSKVSSLLKLAVKEGDPLTLLSFILSRMPDIKRNKAKEWLSSGSLWVNGDPHTQFDYQLFPSDIVHVRSESVRGCIRPGLNVVFDDDVLIAVEKPIGLPVSLDPFKEKFESAQSVQKIVEEHLKKKKVPNFSKLHLVHEIDEDASGIVLFAKTSAARQSLQRNWSTFGKTCMCLVSGKFAKPQGTLTMESDNALMQSKGSTTLGKKSSHAHPKASIGAPPAGAGRGADVQAGPMHAGIKNNNNNNRTATAAGCGSPASPPACVCVSHYRVMATTRAATPAEVISTLELSLETDFPSQVRLQLAQMGHPILGDKQFLAPHSPSLLPSSSTSTASCSSTGETTSPPPAVELAPTTTVYNRRLFLHHTQLVLAHPLSGDTITIASEAPQYFHDVTCIPRPTPIAAGPLGLGLSPGPELRPNIGENSEQPRGPTSWASIADEDTDDQHSCVSALGSVKVVTLSDFLGVTTKSHTARQRSPLSPPLPSPRKPRPAPKGRKGSEGTKRVRG